MKYNKFWSGIVDHHLILKNRTIRFQYVLFYVKYVADCYTFQDRPLFVCLKDEQKRSSCRVCQGSVDPERPAVERKLVPSDYLSPG